jgi:hypothetical protein
VLEKLRTGAALDDGDQTIKTDGLVLILQELHDTLDALVFEAYGWPADLSDDAILERLVALNKQRTLEEAAGHVRWLRPDYQIPRFGSDAERARLHAEKQAAKAADRLTTRQSTLDLEDDLREMKPKFPTGDELAETASIMRELASAQGALSVDDISRRFAQCRQIEKRVASTILALARLGHIAAGDRADSFVLRRSA